MPDSLLGPDKDKPTDEPGDKKPDEKPVVQPWMEKLSDPTLKSSKSLSKFQTEEALAKSYVELEGRLGKSVVVPAKDASPEEWAKFFDRVGRPKSPDDYAINRGKADEKLVAGFKKIAHEKGLSDDQANSAFGYFNDYLASRDASLSEAYTSKMKEADMMLRKEYGPQYESKLSDAKQAFKLLFPEELQSELVETGMANNPRFVRVLAELGPQINGDSFLKGSGKDKPKKDPLAWMDEKYGSGA